MSQLGVVRLESIDAFDITCPMISVPVLWPSCHIVPECRPNPVCFLGALRD